MGTTVQYDGATIGTFSKSTKSLATSARWMKDDIIITDTGMDADDSLYQDKNGFITVSDDYGTATHTEPLTITENGTYNAPANTAYSSVKVAVPCDSFIESVIDRSVTEVTAEDLEGVEKIGDYCFYYCKNLVSIDLLNIVSIGKNTFSQCTSLTSINMPNTISIDSHGFSYCSSLTNISLPSLTTMANNAFYNCTNIETLYLPKLSAFVTGNYPLSGIKKITSIVLPSIGNLPGWCFADDTLLEKVDLGQNSASVANGSFRNSALDLLILRRSASVAGLLGIAAFEGTPFADGGSGGTLYVPQALIETYQSATNWSTILGYENNQILPIEGSQYEHYYADGTPIE